MSTEIRTWQIADGKLTPLDSALKDEKRTEPYDLEPWLESRPEIIGADLLLIGRQVTSKSGPIDLLAIDRSGNAVIIELKRDELPRECLAQAIDHASDVESWTVERVAAGQRKLAESAAERVSLAGRPRPERTAKPLEV